MIVGEVFIRGPHKLVLAALDRSTFPQHLPNILRLEKWSGNRLSFTFASSEQAGGTSLAAWADFSELSWWWQGPARLLVWIYKDALVGDLNRIKSFVEASKL
jgi:hypothetical protein